MIALLTLALLVPGISVAEQYPPPPLDPWLEQQLIVEAARDNTPDPSYDPAPIPEPWQSLADCESGDWIDGGRSFAPGSARWHSGHTDPDLDERPPWSNGLFYGGLQFTRTSWAWAAEVGGHDVPDNPADAPPALQVAVAKTLQSLQGWGAWPTCSGKLALR